MTLRTAFLLLLFAVIALFAVLNWSAFMAPTAISLGVASVQAPLGLILLAFIALLAAVFLGYLVYLQTTFLMEARRNARELQAQRELADQAEASRFSQLQSFLEAELRKLAQYGDETKAAILARTDVLQQELRSTIEHSGNTLAAYIGELEDRLEHGAPQARR